MALQLDVLFLGIEGADGGLLGFAYLGAPVVPVAEETSMALRTACLDEWKAVDAMQRGQRRVLPENAGPGVDETKMSAFARFRRGEGRSRRFCLSVRRRPSCLADHPRTALTRVCQ